MCVEGEWVDGARCAARARVLSQCAEGRKGGTDHCRIAQRGTGVDRVYRGRAAHTTRWRGTHAGAGMRGRNVGRLEAGCSGRCQGCCRCYALALSLSLPDAPGFSRGTDSAAPNGDGGRPAATREGWNTGRTHARQRGGSRGGSCGPCTGGGVALNGTTRKGGGRVWASPGGGSFSRRYRPCCLRDASGGAWPFRSASVPGRSPCCRRAVAVP